MLFHGSELILQLQNFQMLYLDRDFFSRNQWRSHDIMVYLDFSFRIWILKVIYMAYLGISGFSFRAIKPKFMWQISWKILAYFGIGQIQSLKVIYLAYQVQSLRAWQAKFKVLKDLKASGVSRVFVLSYRVNSKRRKRRKNWLNSGWIRNFLIGIFFLRLLIMLFAEKNFFSLV